MIIKIVTNELKDIKYSPMMCSNSELYVGYDVLEHKKVNMATYPHTLITGGSGTGKSRLLFIILTNLIQNNIELYMGQVSKKELNIFNKCKQVKYVANTLQDLYKMLKHIDKIRIKREKLIGDLATKGVFNIDDYNKITRKKLKHMHIVIDEMAFVMSCKVDSKEIKALKDNCLRILLDILRSGRSSGIFAICCLQQPDKESLPGYLRRMFQCLLCMKQPSKSASQIVLGSGDHRAYYLKLRELLVQTNEECICKTPYIDYSIIRQYIEPFEEHNHKYIQLGNNTHKEPTEKETKTTKVSNKDNVIKIHDGVIKRGVKVAN